MRQIRGECPDSAARTRTLPVCPKTGRVLGHQEGCDTVSAQMQKRHIPGLSPAVIRDRAIVRAQAYGVIAAGLPTNIQRGRLSALGRHIYAITIPLPHSPHDKASVYGQQP
jgi:hypothetical protein